MTTLDFSKFDLPDGDAWEKAYRENEERRRQTLGSLTATARDVVTLRAQADEAAAAYAVAARSAIAQGIVSEAELSAWNLPVPAAAAKSRAPRAGAAGAKTSKGASVKQVSEPPKLPADSDSSSGI